jgi:hypothetical protein
MRNLAIQRLTASGIAAMGLLLASNAHANGITPGTIIGVFGDVGANGEYLNSPALGEDQYVNNTGTAVYSITNSSATSVYCSPPVQTTGSSLK